MLKLYKTPRSRSENDSDSSVEWTIPAGTPYLTKVNGQLVMARDKKNKAAEIVVDLLGEAFGVKHRVIRKRSKSVDWPKTPLLIGGVPYMPQPQLTYSAPLPQQSFSSQSLVQYPVQQASSFCMPNPTQTDFEQLQQINAHFNKMFSYGAPTHTDHTKNEVTKTTVTITKHICTGCGRIRSKKYHQDHPFKEGDKPAPDFCRRCQKDSSSTSSGGGRSERRKRGKKTKHKKYHRKHAEYSSDDKSSQSSDTKTHTKPEYQATEKEPTQIPSKKYILVEQELSEKSERPRSRGRARERANVDEYELDRPPLSPRSRQSSLTRPRSTTRKERFVKQRKPVRPPKFRETLTSESTRRRSPSVEYRIFETVPTSRDVDEDIIEMYPRKIPVHFYDEPLQESPPTSQYYREQVGVEWESSGKDHNVEEAETVRRSPPSRECSEERENIRSSRPQAARQRRRRERNSPVFPVLPQWEAPHVLHPRKSDDVIVVTERFEYRPKKHAHSEEDRRRQEYVDRTTLDVHGKTNHFSAEEAARYYREDWSRVEPEPVREPLRRIEHPELSYRRDRHRDAELSNSEASYEYRRSDGNDPPALTPSSRIYQSTKFENCQGQKPYPLSSDSELGQHVNTTFKRKAVPRRPPVAISQERGRSTSRVRLTDVRGAKVNGTEKALISSPRHSREREDETYVEEVSVSDMTERERIAEGETRHVTFRDTPSIRSAHESWIETTESWPVEAERSESGWEDGVKRGGGSGRNQ